MKNLKNIATELAGGNADIRAEVLLGLCVEKGLQPKDFTVQPDGFFFRGFAHDLYSLSFNEQAKHQKFLAAHLSRPGLYDALPEGLFFQSGAQSKTAKTAGEMAEESRLNKKKEIEIRKFFAPFEHVFFLHSLQNELAEVELLQGLRSGWLKAYFIDFWQLPPEMPAQAALMLVMFLPYVHRIAGDTVATAGVLETILNEPVCLEVAYASNTVGAANNTLSSHTLGSELTCGESFAEQYPVVRVNIGPLKRGKAAQFIEGGSYFSLLQTCYNYFIPANAEVITTVLLKSGAAELVLREEDAPLLGLSSVL